MKSNKIILAVLILSMMITLIFSGCGGGGSVTPPIPDNTDNIDFEEIEPIEVASGEIDLNEGGVVEVTDPNSELYGLKITIEPQKNIRENKENPSLIILKFLIKPDAANCPLPDDQGFLITPFIIKSDFIDVLVGKLEIKYYKEQLINAGVAENTLVKLYREPPESCSWEEVSLDKYTVSNNIVNIPIEIEDLGYSYTLTVNNTATPNPSKNPQPGDLLYKSSRWGTNIGWLPGHVGIYVGERYDEESNSIYNVIEAVIPFVKRSYYSPINTFSGDCIYIGAREIKGLSHQQRNKIIDFVDNDNVIGKPYALPQTLISLYGILGLGRGDLVKGWLFSFNCVGLAEAAYESEGVDIVSDYDEGNQGLSAYDILTPAEQWHKTVPVTGEFVPNIPPKISDLAITPEGPVGVNSSVSITCTATDQDKDALTYFWTIPGEEEFIKGKQLDWAAPSIEGEYEISCRVIDNYGGEDSESKDILVGGSTANHPPVITSIAVTSAIKGQTYSYDVNATDPDGDIPVYSLTTNPNGMTINSSTGLITWTPTATGSFGVTVKASDGELFDAQSFTIIVEETSTTTPPATPTSLSPGTTSAPGPIISTLTPTLQWQAVSNADYYNLSVSIYPYGTSNIIYYDQQVYGNSITVPSGELEAGKKYRWNMRAYNSAGYSDYSSDYHFQTESATTPKPDAPTSLSPGTTSAPGPIISTLTPTLQWQAVSNADYYNLSVSIYPYGTSNIIYYDQQVYGNSITVPSGELEAGKKYRWNMRAYNSAGYSDYSSDYYFQTGTTTTPPATPTSLSPGTTSAPGPIISTLTPTLQWQAVSNADYYNLSVSIYPYGTSNIVYYDQQVYGNSITVPSGELEAGNKYRWNMRAYNSAGYSDYSSDYHFQTGTTLGQVQLSSPGNGVTLPPMSVTFIWNPVSNATKYQFILYNQQGQVALDTVKTSTFLIVALGTEETITWKVRAGDNSGNWGAWSSTWSLIIKSLT